MNIWLISKYAGHPIHSKTPTRLFHIAKEFNKLGHKAFVVTSDSNHFTAIPESVKLFNFEIHDSIDLVWIKTKKYKKTASIRRIISWLDFEFKLFRMPLKLLDKPDVVIVSSLSLFTIIYGYYLKVKFNSFLVFEIRDIWPLTLVENGGLKKWHPLVLLMGFIEKFGYMNSDLIVGTMPNLKQHLDNLGIRNKQIFCSPLGFDPINYQYFDTDRENKFRKLLPSNKILIGYAGSMGISNGMEIFIETVKSMNSYHNIHFVLVGSGDLMESYQRILSKNLNVTFLSRIEQIEVKEFLICCDILYLSTPTCSIWDFGQSMNKVVEYMLAAKPIVATYSGYPSMINEAKCGVYVNTMSADELRDVFLQFSMLTDRERMLIGASGRTWIYENRTYNKLAKDYLDKLNSLIS